MPLVISPLGEVIKTTSVFPTFPSFLFVVCLYSHLTTGNKLGWERSKTSGVSSFLLKLCLHKHLTEVRCWPLQHKVGLLTNL